MNDLRDLLVVEDERVVLEAAERVLAPEGIGVDLADDAASASEALRRRSYRVVLCDLMLPGSSGFALLESLRAHRTTQFVVITGFATLENAVESFRRGAFDFLPKPFDPLELLGVVSRALRYHDRVAAASDAEAPPVEDRPATDGELHSLGRHAWARLGPDGSAVVGLGETFSAAVGELAAITLPTAGDLTAQGERLARLIGHDQLVHRVWAPLGGRVIAVNERLSTEPDLAVRDPYGDGWLVSMVPSHLDDELSLLTRSKTPVGNAGGNKPWYPSSF